LKKFKVHLWEDVKLVADERKRLGAISILEDVKTNEVEFEIRGRAGWFSSSDPEMTMKIVPSNIEKIISNANSVTLFLNNMKFHIVDVRFKNSTVKEKCYDLVCHLIERYKENLVLQGKLRAKYKMGDLSDISPEGFEKLIEELYEILGHKVKHVGRGGDEGIDLFCTNLSTGQKIVIQCKRYQKNVGTPELRNFVGAITGNRYGATRGVFVTTSKFTSDALLLARRSNIDLIDGERLLELLRKYY
jgi:HJR/Mrr/RecB family endonuclease